jgi:hypothetical protein
VLCPRNCLWAGIGRSASVASDTRAAAGRLLDHVGLGEMSMLVSYLVVSGDEQVARALSRSDAAGCFCGAGPPDESVPRGVSFRACC